MPLLWAAALRPGWMEDAGAQRSARSRLASSCGRATKAAVLDPALSPGSEHFRRPSCWDSSVGFSCSSSWPDSGGFWCICCGRTAGFLVRLEAVEATLAEGPRTLGPSERHPRPTSGGTTSRLRGPTVQPLLTPRRPSPWKPCALSGQAADDALHRPRLRPP